MLRPGVVQAEVFGINVALLLVLSTQLDAGAGALLSLMALVNGLFIAAIIGVFCGSLSRRGRSALPVCVAALAACLVSASFDAGLLQLGTWRIAEAVRLLSDGVDLRYIVDAGVRSVGATEIGDGTKVDNLVQIGHGSRVGENTLLCGQVGLAGSSVIGSNVILAGQSAVAGHCTIGDGAILTAQSAVSHDVPPGKMVSGSPGFDNRLWLRAVAIFQRLPELLKRLDRVEKAVAAQSPQETSQLKDGSQ